MDSHEGVDAIERAWGDGLKPDPLLTVSEWADRYRVLSQRASSEPGRWRTERTPYLREIMDCLSPASPVQRVALMKGAQIGGTECGNCWIGYVIHQAPGPMMAVSPTVGARPAFTCRAYTARSAGSAGACAGGAGVPRVPPDRRGTDPGRAMGGARNGSALAA
jgi:phage terminase large subunit GpA-like protein